MTPEQQEQLHAKIEKHLRRTKSEIEELRELTKPIELSNTIGRLSRMDAINNKSVNESALRNAEDKLKRLEFSQSKVGTAAFGRCVDCKREIGFPRLYALPDSIKCISCAG